LKRYLLEESYEAVEALDRLEAGDDGAYEHLEEELGDVLLQVFFHSAIAGEAGAFTVTDVARGINRSSSAVIRTCSARCRCRVPTRCSPTGTPEAGREGRASVMDGVTSTLPGLMYAAADGVKKRRRPAPVARCRT